MKIILNLFSSLRLTVVLLTLSLLLVFFGTLDQVYWGINKAQKLYFESFFVVWPYRPEGYSLRLLGVPLPGGYLLGGLLVINLCVAHLRYYRKSWRKVGISLIHGGLVLLIVSGFAVSFMQQESRMWLKEGEITRYTEDFEDNELVLINRSHPGHDEVISIPISFIKGGQPVAIPDSNLSVVAREFYPNANIGRIADNPGVRPTSATDGVGPGMGLAVFPMPVTYEPDKVNTVTAVVEVYEAGQRRGSWLVSNLFDERFAPQMIATAEGDFEIALRFRRYYLPYAFYLNEFRHDRYPGTDIPRNFSSRITILDENDAPMRQVLIYMNHPLRYEGLTFYQASFAEDDTASMLQVVRNPSWLLPYIAVAIMSLGLFWQFLAHLIAYTRRKPAS